jgi:sigma54-dependent transcription regulator
MQREPAAFPWDVREAALRIREFVAGHDFNTYKNSYLVQQWSGSLKSLERP